MTVRIRDAGPGDWPAEVAEDLAAAARAAVEGGIAARPYYRDDELDVHRKSAGDPVTEADHAANAAILAVLAMHRAGDAVVSEEAPPRSGDGSDRLWVVDPLDGTKEFIARNGEFAVMVGLARDGAAVLGAVLKPDPGRLYVGHVDGGAWVADVAWAGEPGPAADGEVDAVVGAFEPLRLAEFPPDVPRLVRSRSHPDPLIVEVAGRLGADSVLSGSVGVKCALIAEGAAELYVHPVPYIREWDTCAPEAILRGAGGRVTDCAGEPLTYGKPDPGQSRGIFAGRPETWATALPLVREVTSAKLGFDL